MKNVLLISKTEQSVVPLVEMLKGEGYNEFKTALTSEQAINEIELNEYDIIVINTPILNSNGIDLSFYMTDKTRSGVFLIIKSDLLETIQMQIEDHGVFVIPKPINKHYFHHALRLWEVSKIRIEGLAKENLMLKNKVEEINLVNRAKYVLMQCLSMSEAQAHKYLEKQSMDMRQTKMAIAEQVLNTYEV